MSWSCSKKCMMNRRTQAWFFRSSFFFLSLFVSFWAEPVLRRFDTRRNFVEIGYHVLVSTYLRNGSRAICFHTCRWNIPSTFSPFIFSVSILHRSAGNQIQPHIRLNKSKDSGSEDLLWQDGFKITEEEIYNSAQANLFNKENGTDFIITVNVEGSNRPTLVARGVSGRSPDTYWKLCFPMGNWKSE